jgi:hypothetical protein
VIAMPERPIVMPTRLDNESRNTCRKLRPSGPSLPRGSLVLVEVSGRWIKARVEKVEFATVYLERVS